MKVLQTIYNVFSMFGGLAVFLVGMKFMSDSLEAVAGSEMKKLFDKISDNRFKGFAIGATVTAVIQSSAATSVMLVGFVNVGLLTLVQATPILLGSIVGTTITAQLTSLSAFNITAIMSLVAGGGAVFYLFSKNDKAMHVGAILLGLGMLFIGLSLMSGSMKSIAFNADGTPTKIAAFVMDFENPFLCVIFMALFTAIIQSSSASTSVMVALATAGVLTNPISAMYMVLGTHIGTTITALLASAGTTVNARRTAVINLLIGILGTVAWFIVLLLFANPISRFVLSFSGGMERFVANFHTFSNFVTAICMMFFVKPISDLAVLLVPQSKEDERKSDIKKLHFLDERILSTPSLAVGQSIAEIRHMADLAQYNIIHSIDMVMDLDLSDEPTLIDNESRINFLNIEITNYLEKFSTLDLSAKDDHIIGSLFHVVSDIERIGDYAENVMQFADKMKKENLVMSDAAKADLLEAKELLEVLYKDSIETFTTRNKFLLAKVDVTEKSMDLMKEKMQKMHVVRMNDGTCSAEVGAIYLSLASQLERVADHMTNIAYSIIPYDEKVIIGDIKNK